MKPRVARPLAPLAVSFLLACGRQKPPEEATSRGDSPTERAGPSTQVGSDTTTLLDASPAASIDSEETTRALPDARTAADAGAEPPFQPSFDGMIYVPVGEFTMGADRGGQDDERPAHVVTLPGYFLDRTETTNEAYERCVAARTCRPHDPGSSSLNHFGSDAEFRRPEQPISSISWDDAKTFCTWSGKRLATEAEWEKAARGVDGRKYPWGNETPDRDRAVYASSRTEDVGSRPRGAGPYGHLDMAGNVWEWLEDIYDPYAYRRPGASQGMASSCDDAIAAEDELRK